MNRILYISLCTGLHHNSMFIYCIYFHIKNVKQPSKKCEYIPKSYQDAQLKLIERKEVQTSKLNHYVFGNKG